MRVSDLRAARWGSLPADPGVYWWYFPESALEQFQIAKWCKPASLRLRWSEEGRVCLYHGMATSLRQRIQWHAAQALSISALRSGFLSTFRFTLLALNGFDYMAGTSGIDRFMDGLDVLWQTLPSVHAAKEQELRELATDTFHYPLNIQGNRHSELAGFVQRLKEIRKTYKQRFLESTACGKSVARAS
jgi:hypothetical protein